MDFDNQDLGAILLLVIAIALIWKFQEVTTAAPGLPATTLTAIVTAFIAWINPKK